MQDFTRRTSGLYMPKDEDIKVKGAWVIEHWRPIMVDGKPRRELIHREFRKNIVVNQGLDHILGVEFAAVPQITQWFIGLFSGNYSPVGTDTASTFPNNSQESTSYGQTRQQFSAAEGGQSANNNASAANFTFQAADTIYGAFLVSSQAVKSTQGVMFSAVTFATSRQVAINDQLAIGYAVTATSG